MTEFLERKKEWVFFGALLVLGILVYSNTWNVPFQFDDHRMIEKNLSIRNGVNIPRIWAENSKARFVPVVSFALSYSLGGEQPFGYHLFNVGLHLCNALWVYFLLSLILASPRMRGIYSPKAAFYLAAFGALIFVVHPLQTQAVTYIVQRIAALAAFFYLGAIVLYLKARSGSGAWYYAGAVGMAAAAMFCKENAVTLPFAIVMIEFLFFDQKDGKMKTFIRLLPFLITLIIVPAFMHSDTARHDVEHDVLIPIQTKALSRGPYFLTQLNVLCTYLRLFLFPVNQNLDYDYPVAHALMEPRTLFCALGLLGLLAAGVFFLRKNRLVSFAIFWFFMTLSVESSIVPIKDVIFEHRMYLPLAGFGVLLPVAVLFMLENLSSAAIAGTVVVLIFSGMAFARNHVWESKISLWEDVVRKSPGKGRGYFTLGSAYFTQKGPAEALKLYQKGYNTARELSSRGLPVDPAFAKVYNDLAIFYAESGKLDGAIEILEEGIQIAPAFVPIYDNLGLFYKRKGNLPKALSLWQKALELDPEYPPSSFRFGILFKDHGNLKQAEAFLKRALELNPLYAEAILALGEVNLRQGDIPAARQQLEKLKKTDQKDFSESLERWIRETAAEKTAATSKPGG